jgi:hypothetical protein
MPDLASPETTPRPRKTLALVSGLFLAGVGVLALFSTAGNDWGEIRDCSHCGLKGQPVAKGWIEVPPGDSWAIALEPGMGVVVRGPARFEMAGPRPGKRTMALSRGVLFAQVATAGHAVVMMQRTSTPLVEGVSATNTVPGTRLDIEAKQGGNLVRAGKGAVLLDVAGGPTLKAGEVWKSGAAAGDPPQPTAEEQAWLDQLAP